MSHHRKPQIDFVYRHPDGQYRHSHLRECNQGSTCTFLGCKPEDTQHYWYDTDLPIAGCYPSVWAVCGKDTPVIWVENETMAGGVKPAGFVPLTTIGGAKDAHLSNWTSYKDHRIYFWSSTNPASIEGTIKAAAAAEAAGADAFKIEPVQLINFDPFNNGFFQNTIKNYIHEALRNPQRFFNRLL